MLAKTTLFSGISSKCFHSKQGHQQSEEAIKKGELTKRKGETSKERFKGKQEKSERKINEKTIFKRVYES